MDSRFRVDVLSKTENPQTTIYAALHQDYSEEYIFDKRDSFPNEQKCGEVAVTRLLKGERGHYGCYTEDTSVLTERGWVLWPEVKTNDSLLAVNYMTGEARFEQPKALQVYELAEDDNIFVVDDNSISLAVTTDHRMVVAHDTGEQGFRPWVVKPASELSAYRTTYLLSTNLRVRDRSIICNSPFGVSLLNLIRLAGIYFGNNSLSSSDEKHLEIFCDDEGQLKYLETLGFDHIATSDTASSGEYKSSYRLDDPDICRWIFNHFQSEEKTIPDWLWRSPQILLDGFFEGLEESIAYSESEDKKIYTYSKKKPLEALQTVFHLNNKAAVLKGVEDSFYLEVITTSITVEQSRHSTQSYVGKVYCATVSTGALLVKHNDRISVSGNCVEHVQIAFATGWFPHSVMQQARTHRISTSFDVQSMRYTGDRICRAATGDLELEEAFYLRPVGHYHDRQGKKYDYTQEQRELDLLLCAQAAKRYKELIELGYAEEHARGILPFDYRQHFVVSFNARSVLHFMDLRAKADAQLEIQQLCELMWVHVKEWIPEIAEYYEKNRLHKARLAP
jgi:thymidylate synthase (FAD)